MARITRQTKNTAHIEFDKTVKDQVGVVHMFDTLLGKELARTCDACGGVVPEDQKGRTVPKRARCSCPVEDSEETPEAGSHASSSEPSAA